MARFSLAVRTCTSPAPLYLQTHFPQRWRRSSQNLVILLLSNVLFIYLGDTETTRAGGGPRGRGEDPRQAAGSGSRIPGMRPQAKPTIPIRPTEPRGRAPRGDPSPRPPVRTRVRPAWAAASPAPGAGPQRQASPVFTSLGVAGRAPAAGADKRPGREGTGRWDVSVAGSHGGAEACPARGSA